MKKSIKIILVKRLRNSLHFEFMSSILVLLQTIGASISLITGLVHKFATLVGDEDIALDQLRRFDTTDEIHEQDDRRDNAFYQLCNYVRAGFKHFDENRREAAGRLHDILKDYKETPKLPLAEESAKLHNLLQKLETVRGDIDILGLGEWIYEMKDANDKVRSLMANRESETANKSQHKVKTVRAAVDEAYYEILTCLEAVTIVENPDVGKQLVAEINARIDEYNNVLAREKGWRNRKNNETETEEDN
jgi:hypothetical protein